MAEKQADTAQVDAVVRDALFAAFSEEFARRYKTPNEALKNRVWAESYRSWNATGGGGGFRYSTVVRAMRILAESRSQSDSSPPERPDDCTT